MSQRSILVVYDIVNVRDWYVRTCIGPWWMFGVVDPVGYPSGTMNYICHYSYKVIDYF